MGLGLGLPPAAARASTASDSGPQACTAESSTSGPETTWSGSVVRVRVRVSGQGHGVRVRVKVRVRVRFRIGARAEVRSRDNLVDATLDVVQRAWLGRGLGVRLGFARNLCRVRALRAISGVV